MHLEPKSRLLLDTHKSVDLATEVDENTDAGGMFLMAVDCEGYEDSSEHLVSKSSDSHADARCNVPSGCLFQLKAPD